MLLSNDNPTFWLIQKAFASSTGVTTDTRTADAGKLFFALKGENFDGNQYAQQALNQGCIRAIIDDATIAKQLNDVILVDDVLIALQTLARWHRRQWQCPVIGLTGSNGKTTTKELLKAVCASRFPGVKATRGNLNNEIGVPLTLLAAGDQPDFVIVEMGANAQGEIALLAEIAEPTHGVITNIGRAHLEGFGGVKGVLKGKRELFDFFRNKPGTLTSDISVFVNQNHSVLVEASDSIPRAFYGSQQHPPFVSEVHDDFNMSWVDLEGSLHGPMRCQVSGDHNFENMMTAAAVGLYFGVSADACSDALSSYAPDNNRSQWTKTERNQVLLDAYNANPSSMESALTFFEGVGKNATESKELVAILGDMGELGKYAENAHREVLELALEKGLNVITVGPLFHQAGKNHPTVHSFMSTAELKAHLKQSPLSGHHVLLKGSRSIALEEALGAL
jgi:UDP-N-acetylmuramoyl-tripeptide--D-alanyl-D-alanine ligase